MTTVPQFDKPRKSLFRTGIQQLNLWDGHQFTLDLVWRMTLWFNNSHTKAIRKLRGLTSVDRLLLKEISDYAWKGKNSCHPGAATLAEDTELSRATVYRSLDRLEERKLISRSGGGGREGNFTEITLTLDPEQPVQTSFLDPPKESQQCDSLKESHGEQRVSSGEGKSLKRPLKESHLDPRNKEVETYKQASMQTEPLTPPVRVSPTPSQVDHIYSHYPKKVARPAALKSITAAIKRLLNGEAENIPFTGLEDVLKFLEERVKLFAASPAGQAGQFCPYPSTWFNQTRYLDDDRVWYAPRGDVKESTQQARMRGTAEVLNRVLLRETQYERAMREIEEGEKRLDERFDMKARGGLQ